MLVDYPIDCHSLNHLFSYKDICTVVVLSIAYVVCILPSSRRISWYFSAFASISQAHLIYQKLY